MTLQFNKKRVLSKNTNSEKGGRTEVGTEGKKNSKGLPDTKCGARVS